MRIREGVMWEGGGGGRSSPGAKLYYVLLRCLFLRYNQLINCFNFEYLISLQNQLCFVFSSKKQTNQHR